MSITLNVGQSSAVGLQFEAENFAVMNRDDIRNSGNGADRLEDFRLDDAAPAAERHVESEESLYAPPCDVLEDGGLDLLLRAMLATPGGVGRDKAASTLLDDAGRVALDRHREVRGGLSPIWSWARTGEVLPEYRLAPSPRSVTALRRARAFCAPHSHRCNGVLLALAAPLLGGLARN